jgi:hypothetical protein
MFRRTRTKRLEERGPLGFDLKRKVDSSRNYQEPLFCQCLMIITDIHDIQIIKLYDEKKRTGQNFTKKLTFRKITQKSINRTCLMKMI